jgi:histone deacetylase 11
MTDDQTFLQDIKLALTEAINGFQPEFVVYNAGTDILEKDPLGRCSISPNGIIERDAIVFEKCLEKKIPITMLMSGGYQQSNAKIIADSIGNLIKKYDLINYSQK